MHRQNPLRFHARIRFQHAHPESFLMLAIQQPAFALRYRIAQAGGRLDWAGRYRVLVWIGYHANVCQLPLDRPHSVLLFLPATNEDFGWPTLRRRWANVPL